MFWKILLLGFLLLGLSANIGSQSIAAENDETTLPPTLSVENAETETSTEQVASSTSHSIEEVGHKDHDEEVLPIVDPIETKTEEEQEIQAQDDIVEQDQFDDGFDGVSERNRPQDLEIVASTQRSITIKWNFEASSQPVIGYNIFFSTDGVEASYHVEHQTSVYEIPYLEPYTLYKIWIVAILGDGSRSQPSEPIRANTDVDQPSPPQLLNATCFGTGSIYIEWRRPVRFDKSVDYYKLYHKMVTEPTYRSITIQANAKEEIISFVLDNLSGNVEYVLMICAATKSLSNPNKTWLGEPSSEKVVFLPEDKCDLGIFAPKMAGEYSAGIIAGVGCALFLLLLSVILFLTRRKRLKQRQFAIEKIQAQPVSPPELFSWEEKFGPDWSNESIPLDKFIDHVSELHIDSDVGFSKEYEEIQKYSRKVVKATHEHSSNPENKTKNRYLNIVAYDHTRVRLLPVAGQKKSSDYINANFIDSFKQSNAYIGTQGPLESTFESFWKMVWEQNVYVIVMITNLTEKSRKKCDRYWPAAESETYGVFEVVLTKEETMSNYTVRTIKLKHTKLKGASSLREVKQFHYCTWPDHGVPCHPLPVLTYIRKSVEANPPDGGPIIVHCSAGVGRTGTYIAIDSMLQQIEFKKALNVFGFLKHIRGQRNHLVQTEEQYVFIHDALVEAIQSGNTEVVRDQLADYIDKLDEVICKEDCDDFDPEPQRVIEKQFKLVTAYKPPDFFRTTSNTKYNIGKNRNPELVPVDIFRIILAPKPGVDGSDYINATWLHGHHKLNEFIITQHPQNNEAEDFWRALWDHSAQTVVLLSATDQQDFPTFWPAKNSDFNFETFRVRFVEDSVHEGHSTLDFSVSSNHDDFGLAVRIIYCPLWPTNVAQLEDVFSVLKVVQDWHLEYQNGPLVVVDKFGGREAATFCALTTLCKELESFNSVDIYQVAKLYHQRRPGVWKSPDDLMFLYRAINALVVSKRTNPLHDRSPTSTSENVASSVSVDLSPSSNGTVDHNHVNVWPIDVRRGVKKSLSGDGFESAATSTTTTATTNANDDEVCEIMTRRFSFPATFKNNLNPRRPVSNGCAINIPNDDEELTENLAQKSPLLKVNSNGV